MTSTLPDNIQWATREPDGSDVFLFTDQTKWVLSTCPTCQHESLIEIMHGADGRVEGVRFLPSDQDSLPADAIAFLQAKRAQKKHDFSIAWADAEESPN